jgi:hypothetical protein
MTGTNCDLFTHKQSRSYMNHLVNRYHHTVYSVLCKGKLQKDNKMYFHDRRRKTMRICVRLEGIHSSSGIRVSNNYTDVDTSLQILTLGNTISSR